MGDDNRRLCARVVTDTEGTLLDEIDQLRANLARVTDIAADAVQQFEHHATDVHDEHSYGQTPFADCMTAKCQRARRLLSSLTARLDADPDTIQKQFAALGAECDALREESGRLAHLSHHHESENSALRAENARQAAEIARLLDVIRMRQPYPILSVLEILADAVDHLLRDHNCDATGHETRRMAMLAAREMIESIKGVMRSNPDPRDAEIARLREVLSEIVSIENHAGKICRECHSAVGRAQGLIELARAALGATPDSDEEEGK